jgi:hypothetical protein
MKKLFIFVILMVFLKNEKIYLILVMILDFFKLMELQQDYLIFGIGIGNTISDFKYMVIF